VDSQDQKSGILDPGRIEDGFLAASPYTIDIPAFLACSNRR
jgi:hypothetical protein